MDWNLFHSQAGQTLGEDFWQEIAALIPNTGPRFDMYYTPNTVVVLTEMPGLRSADQIRIYLEGPSLIVEGEIPRTYPVTDNRITIRERFFGSFRRVLPMPKVVSPNGITAQYSDGLLVIELTVEPGDQASFVPIAFNPKA